MSKIGASKNGLLLCLISFCICLVASSTLAQEHRWKYYSIIPDSHPYSKIFREGFEKIKERSENKLAIEHVYYNETPYKATQALSILRDGLVEMSDVAPGYLGGTYPLISAPELPFLFPKSSSAEEGMNLADRAWKSKIIGEYTNQIFRNNRSIWGMTYYYQPMNFWFSKKADGIESFKGLRVRVFSPELAELMVQVGGIPNSMTLPEVYEAMQRQTIDGLITGSAAVTGLKLDEVVKYALIGNIFFTSTFAGISDAAYKKLSRDHQEILMTGLSEISEAIRRKMPETDNAAKSAMTQRGISIIQMQEGDYAAFRTLARERIWPAWEKRVGAGGKEALADLLKSVETQ